MQNVKQLTNSHDGDNLFATRGAGVCLHITALPGPHGIGELGQSAFRFVDCLTAMRMSVWQFLPTGPTAYGDSPYQPLSTFAGNELLIDIRDLVAKRLLDNSEVGELLDLSKAEVDYGNLIPVKTRLLALAASRFEERADSDLKVALEGFVA
ncbi:MAG: 4-alpha-glucanotransferase, partial [Pseudomonadota bacterium]